MQTHRPVIMGRRGAVGANHPLAAQAGLDTLRAGGNAFDAAVAIGLALGVVEPMMSGLGGDGFYHCHVAATQAAVVFNATGYAPAAATPDIAGLAIDGPTAVSVPGMLGGLAAMHAAHGSLPWARLAEPAIGLAKDGFAATRRHCELTRDTQARLAADPDSAAVFLPDGRAPSLGDWITQPALARTLQDVASDGAEGFYRGALARRLARGMAERGVPVTGADLAGYRPEVTAPIAIAYRGYEIRQTPPNSTGFVMLQMLGIAAHWDLAALSPAERVHVLVEAKKRAFVDRERHGADPRFEDVPVERLLSAGTLAAHAAAIRMDHAADLPLPRPAAAHGETTYFGVIDGLGNAVSGIQSLNSAYGSGVTAGDTGVLLNNRMAYWHLAPGHPNRLRPGKRVRHTMNAPMVFQDGKLWGVLGTPGADHQVQVNLQVLVALLDLGADPQQALELPRWSHSQPGQDANWPHSGDGRLTIEADVGEDVLADLQRRGHVLNRVGHLDGPCAMQAIRVLPNGVLAAGSDPRRDGWAAAW